MNLEKIIDLAIWITWACLNCIYWENLIIGAIFFSIPVFVKIYRNNLSIYDKPLLDDMLQNIAMLSGTIIGLTIFICIVFETYAFWTVLLKVIIYGSILWILGNLTGGLIFL